MMYISRIEVEGGFLDGLDLQLAPGLNVLIGARGTGKTSVIELTRFALGVSRVAPSKGSPFEPARAVLGSGRVTVTIAQNGDAVQVVRTATDPDPVEPVIDFVPLILAQNEIEEVGEDPWGRLNLIDGFRPARDSDRRTEAAIRVRVRNLTAAIATAVAEAATLQDQLVDASDLVEQLETARTAQAEFSEALASHTQEQTALAVVDQSLSDVQVRVDTLDRALSALRSWTEHLENAAFHMPVLEPAAQGSPDALGEARQFAADAGTSLRHAVSSASRAVAAVELSLSSARDDQNSLQDKARALRRELESAQAGAGAASRTVSDLRSRIAQLESIRELHVQKQDQIRALQADRDAALTDLESLRRRRFQDRTATATALTKTLAPYVQVELTRAGLYDGYVRALVGALQGSNLRYNSLAPQIAAAIPPTELVRIAESGDADALASIISIDRDRAARIVGYLSDHGLEEIVGVEIEDLVELLLLDGMEYKSTEHLSTGQRCTVVLPILLEDAGRSLIVDQPEDHVDNNFVADILIPAIRRRKEDTQLLMSSHNANIPVLGEADRVVYLGSNGTRGFVRTAGSLDDPEIVEAITSVMEGGREAFLRRAAFYRERLGLK